MVNYMNQKTKTYLTQHQIYEDTMDRWGVYIKGESIAIPIKGIDGQIKFNKYRHLSGDIKYSYDKGSSMELFAGYLITPMTEDIFIVEGELKAIALNELIGANPASKAKDRKTVAVSSTGGAMSFKSEWFELFKGKKIHILLDNDKPGHDGAMILWKKMQHIEGINSVKVYNLPDGYKDINEYIHDNESIAWHEMIPESLSLTCLHSPKRTVRLRGLREFLSKVQEYEFRVYTETHRYFISKLREIANAEMVANQYRDPKDIVAYGESLDDVKKVPIDSIVQFKNGVAPCIFHADKNPSMHYNDFNSAFPNTVKCYSCGKFADVIDVIMAINNVDFKEAINILKGK